MPAGSRPSVHLARVHNLGDALNEWCTRQQSALQQVEKATIETRIDQEADTHSRIDKLLAKYINDTR